MPTLNQERAAKRVKEVIEKNLDIDGGSLLKSVDYGIGFQRSPGRVFKSKGFRKAMEKLGFSIEAADLTVAKILRTGREENQLKASDQIYKRLGGYQQGDVPVLNISQLLILINGGTQKAERQDVESK